MAAFIVYGSLVPFDLRRASVPSSSLWLEQVRFTPWSPSDLLVNIAVGVPLGFFLMGAFRSRRRPTGAGLLTAVLLVGGISALLGTSVELLQVLSPTRQSSWNDVLAQEVGACSGTVGWIVAGPRFTQWLRCVANR